MSSTVSASRLAGLTGREEIFVLDARPLAAYNGWPLRGEPAGGHVPGARPFPLAWMETLEPDSLGALLQEKGVEPAKTIAVYGYGQDDGQLAADRLERIGYRDILRCVDGLFGWIADPRRPLERLPRYEQLVHPGWLARQLERRALERAPSTREVLVHVNFDNRAEYDREHIPGAIHMDTLALEEPERWNRRPAGQLARALADHGITARSRVVVYGRTGRPDMSQAHPGREAGQIGAMRAAILMMYAGVEDVRVLDGGLDAWRTAGLPVTSSATEPSPAESFGASVPGRSGLMIDIAEAKQMLDDPGAALVSVRSWPEFIGEVSGYHYVKPKGRIPGATFGNCGSDAYHMQNYRNHDNTLRCHYEIEQQWREVGVTPDKRVAFYCGTGWRAAEACFCAHLMGWEHIAVYDGGWFEWSIDEENPLETGPPAEPPPGFR